MTYVEDEDQAYDDFCARVDAGEECPRCHAEAPRFVDNTVAFGLPIHVCKVCRTEWFGLFEQRKRR